VDDWSVSHHLTAQEQDTVYGWLSAETYWSKGLPRAVFDRSIANSFCFGLKDRTGQLRGFARLITDHATFAYLCDVFVEASVRGRGAGKALIGAIMTDPELRDLRRWMLITRDAHGLYERFGFTALTHAERFMQRHDPDVYARKVSSS
jgi:N-acetylglutamate synthase-like GNAT family acetyltransferase